jgi:hypothetical protein
MSIVRCIAKLNRELRDFNIGEVRDAAQAYRARNLEEREANVKAVEDHLRDLAQQRARVVDQVHEAWRARDPEGHAKAMAALKAEEAPEIASHPMTEISDFGEKLGGAKKDLHRSLEHDFSDDEIAREPFSKIWPADTVKGIEDKYAAAVAHTARAEVPAKPRVEYKLRRWVEAVKSVREIARHAMEGKRDSFETALSGRRGLDGFRAKVSLLEAIDRDQWDRIGSVNEYPHAYRYEGGKQVEAPMVRAQIDGRSHDFADTKTVADVVERVNGLLGKDVEAKKMQFEVRGRPGDYWINKRGDREYRKLKAFADAKEALSYRQTHYDDLVQAWEGVKEKDNVRETDVRGAENRPRSGADYRKGKDVTPEQFSETFGFRGVEFGNWVSQGAEGKARQGMLNQAFDALHDLANIVGVEPRALSLNGSLGLAFGSRGSGKFSAHFEPGALVINLTKTRGAGALAHEWFHALDNYFARQRGGEVKIERGLNAQRAYREQNFISYRPEPMVVRKDGRGFAMSRANLERLHKEHPDLATYDPTNWKTDPSHPAGVRPEVEAAWADVVKALNDSPMAARARSIDKGEDGYWSQIIERGARSFENYVLSKMMEKGYHNDYLSNVTPAELFARDKSRYPYLLPEEAAPISEAFDNLFSTLKTKETDKGLALFKRAEPTGGMEVKAAEDIARTITARWKNAPEVVVVESMHDPKVPERVQNEDAAQRAQGAEGQPAAFFYGDKVYLVASESKSPKDVTSYLFHEALGHYGLRGVFGDIRPHHDRPSRRHPRHPGQGQALRVRQGHRP